MRELFIVGIKLYGVMSLFSGVSSCLFLIQIAQLDAPSGTAYTWLISMAVSVLIVFAALTQAEKLADVFGLTAEGSTRFSGFSSKATLKVGLILIGASQFLGAAPALLLEITRAGDPVMGASSQSVLGVLIQALIALALVFRSNRAIEFIEEHAGTSRAEKQG